MLLCPGELKQVRHINSKRTKRAESAKKSYFRSNKLQFTRGRFALNLDVRVSFWVGESAQQVADVGQSNKFSRLKVPIIESS